jgi:hypothetical protein
MEALCLLVQMRQDSARFLETFALVQAIAMASDSDQIRPVRQALAHYRQALMPYVAQDQRREEDEIRKALAVERQRGPLRVRSQEQPSFRSRLREAVRRRWRQS